MMSCSLKYNDVQRRGGWRCVCALGVGGGPYTTAIQAGWCDYSQTTVPQPVGGGRGERGGCQSGNVVSRLRHKVSKL